MITLYTWSALPPRHAKRVALEKDGEPKDGEVHPGVADRLGVADLLTPLVDGEGAAGAED